jgi:hypothetical protein
MGFGGAVMMKKDEWLVPKPFLNFPLFEQEMGLDVTHPSGLSVFENRVHVPGVINPSSPNVVLDFQ